MTATDGINLIAGVLAVLGLLFLLFTNSVQQCVVGIACVLIGVALIAWVNGLL